MSSPFIYLQFQLLDIVSLDEPLNFADWLLTFNMLSDVDSLKGNLVPPVVVSSRFSKILSDI
ncbi:hypothetical protein ACTXT7_016159 [Hymenolepis weldensis]